MKPIPILSMSASLLLVGCVPFRVEIGRQTVGTVISRDTQKQIAGAHVMYKGHPSTAVITDTEGRFVLEQATVTKWLVPIPVDYFGWSWHPLKVYAEGYRTRTFEQAS